MRRFLSNLARWRSVESERGVTAMEYGLITAIVAVAIITAMQLIGVHIGTVFSTVSANL